MKGAYDRIVHICSIWKGETKYRIVDLLQNVGVKKTNAKCVGYCHITAIIYKSLDLK